MDAGTDITRGRYLVPEDRIHTVNETLEDVYNRLLMKMYYHTDEGGRQRDMEELARLRNRPYRESEEEVAHKLCVTARKMDEMLDAMLNSREDRQRHEGDVRPGYGHREDRGVDLYNDRERQGRRPYRNQKRQQPRITNRPRSADARPPPIRQDRVTFSETTLVQKQLLVELRKKIIDMEKENEHLKEDNRSLRMLSEKQSKLKRTPSSDQRMQSIIRTETKHLKKTITDLEQRLAEDSVIQASLQQEKDAQMIKLKTFETEAARKTADLEQIKLKLSKETEAYQDARDRNLKLIAEKELIQTKLDELEKSKTQNLGQEMKLRQHVKEEYDKKLKTMEKELEFTRKRLAKKKETEQSKNKQEVTQISEHYQEIIINLRKERESLQLEKEEALSSLQKLADQEKALAAKQVSKYLSKLRDLEKQLHAEQQENSLLTKENEEMKISMNKIKERKGKETDSIVHIEEILRKHKEDLEKKVQLLELEKKEGVDENKSLEQRISQRENEIESLRQQLKSTREVLENRISELHQKNDQILSKNEELVKTLNSQEQEWLDRMTKAIGQEEISKRDVETHFHDVIAKFQREKSELDKEIENLRKKLVELQERNQESQRHEMDDEEVKRQQEKIGSLEREIEEMKKEKDTARERLKGIESELQQIAKEADESKISMKIDYELKLEALRSEKADWSNEREQLQARIQELEYTISIQSREEEEGREDEDPTPGGARPDVDELLQQRATLEHNIENAAKEFEEKEKEWNVKIEEAMQKEDTLQGRVTELEHTLQRESKENEMLQNRICEQDRVIKHYQQKADDLLRSREEHRLEKEKLRRSVGDKEANKDKELFEVEIRKEKEKLREIEEKLEKDLESLKLEKTSWQDEKCELQTRILEIEKTMGDYIKEIEDLQCENTELKNEKNVALNRLSEVASSKLRDNNAALADLSDENRPTKLGETFNELYDNEWTDALEKLEKDLKMPEKDALQCLLGMVKIVFQECKDIADIQLKEIATLFGIGPEDTIKLKSVKDFRKSVALDFVPKIVENIMQKTLSSAYERERSHCEPFIKRCIELCWLIRVQDPPLFLDFSAQNGDAVDESLYMFFTQTGDYIDHLVWPVLFLHHKGPLLKKGVVQAFRL